MTDATRSPAGQRPDLRLVPAAAASWLAALTAVPLARAATGAALLGSMAAVLAAGALLVTGRRRPAVVVIAAAMACAGAVLVGALLRVSVTSGGTVAALAAERAVATVDLVVTGDPRSLPARRGSFGSREQVLVSVRVERLTARGQEWTTRVPVLALATDTRWLDLLPSQRVRAAGRLAPAERGDSVAALLLARGPPLDVRPPSLLQHVAGTLRAGLRRSVSHLPADERGLLPGLVVGDTAEMPVDLVERFRTAGLTHLVAVSGANVAIVLTAALLAARWAGLRSRAVPAAGLLAILGFLVLARADPSVLRATVCGVAAVVALSRGGRAAGVPALCAAVVVLLLADPGLGRSYGFALSVLATAGLLVLAPGWRQGLARWLPPAVADAVAIPAAAQVVCAPVIAMLSGTLSLVAIPANLVVAPAVAPATVLGVLIALLAGPVPWVAQLLAWAAWVPTAWIVLVARVATEVPGAGVGWPDGALGGLLLAAVTVAVWSGLPVLRRHPRLAVALALVAGLLASPVGLRASWPPPDTRAVVCDVGQGDAIVVVTAPGHALLVDAGPDPEAVDRCLSDVGVRVLDVVLLSHFHADHVEGLPGALRGRSVGAIVVGPLDEPVEEAARVYAWAAAARVPVRQALVGERHHESGVTWEVLWPSRVIRGQGSDPNNASLVLVVDTGGVRLLLTGDVETAAQAALLVAVSALDPPVDVYKVPHHGSRAQDPRVLDAVRPRAAVVSVGADNTYGHPAAETLAALDGLGVPVLRTDLAGDVAVVGFGENLRLVGRRG